MSDVVSAAISHAAANLSANKQTRWAVTFVNNETRTGTLQPLGNGNYAIHGKPSIYFFPAVQVAYLTVSADQSQY